MKEEKLEEAKRLYGSANADQKYVLETLFPELAGSEDEQIKKAILNEITLLEKECVVEERKEVYRTWISWLEKQGEQNSAFEMKTPEESLDIDSDTYNEIVDECIYSEQKSQRMISAEAKEAMYDKPADKVEPKCEESKTKVFDAPTSFEDKLYAFVLACEILVDPSKREFILEHSQEILDAAREQIGKEQGSAWSEKDKKKLNRIYQLIAEAADEHAFSTTCRLIGDRECVELQDFLRSLKPQPKQDWSNEDEKMLSDAIGAVGAADYYTYDDKRKIESWLKSLKDRYTWKPSDEQMKILISEVEGWTKGCPKQKVLESLYNDLKNLK